MQARSGIDGRSRLAMSLVGARIALFSVSVLEREKMDACGGGRLATGWVAGLGI